VSFKDGAFGSLPIVAQYALRSVDIDRRSVIFLWQLYFSGPGPNKFI